MSPLEPSFVSISMMSSANYCCLYCSPACCFIINMNYRVRPCNSCSEDSLEDENLKKLYIRDFNIFIDFSLLVLFVSSFLELNTMTREVWLMSTCCYMCLVRKICQFSKELVQQNLRKYIQIALLVFGAFLKKNSCKVSVRVCI